MREVFMEKKGFALFYEFMRIIFLYDNLFHFMKTLDFKEVIPSPDLMLMYLCLYV